MMRRICIVSSICAAMMSESCTTPVSQDGAHPPARGRILLREFQDRANGGSAIVMLRDNETIVSGCGMTITVDERPVVILEPGEEFTAYVKAADHKLGTQYAPACKGRSGSLSITTHTDRALQIRIRYSLTANVFTSAGETALTQ